MVDVTEIAAILAAAGVLAGVVYYIMDIRNQGKMRQTDVVFRLYSAFSGRELQEAYFTVITLDFVDYDDFHEEICRRW